jgi:hypothetical protein
MTSRPASVVTAAVVLFVQAAANAAGGLLLFTEIADRLDHNQDVPALGHFLAWLSVIVAVALVVSGVLLLRRVGAARPLVIVLEVITIVVGFLNLVSGAPQAVIGIGLAVVVLVSVANRRAGDWFASRGSG